MDKADKGYRRLDAWQSSMQLAREVRGIAGTVKHGHDGAPHESLTHAMQRLSAAVPRAIAHGYRQDGKRYRQLVMTARDSLSELDRRLVLAVRHGYLSPEQTLLARRHASHAASRLNCLAMALEHS